MVSKAVSLIFNKTAAAIQNGLKRSYKGLKGELLVLEYERMVYDFKDDKANENWIAISDAEFGGKSEVAFEKSKHGQCVFRGNISTVLPDDDDEAKYSGFCAAKSKPLMGFMGKVEPHDLETFDTIEIRLRGDGRSYFFNIHPESFQSTDDLYQGFLFTRGGPHWEIIRIPYNSFVLTSHGFVQDNQIRFNNIRAFGFSLSDKKNGPFHLEIDYIRALRMYNDNSEFK